MLNAVVIIIIKMGELLKTTENLFLNKKDYFNSKLHNFHSLKKHSLVN